MSNKIMSQYMQHFEAAGTFMVLEYKIKMSR